MQATWTHGQRHTSGVHFSRVDLDAVENGVLNLGLELDQRIACGLEHGARKARWLDEVDAAGDPRIALDGAGHAVGLDDEVEGDEAVVFGPLDE